MTLGEYPDKVDPVPDLAGRLRQFRVRHRQVPRHRRRRGGRPLQHGRRRHHGRFRQRRPPRPLRHQLRPTQSMAFYHNKGDGTFEDRTGPAGLGDQLGGLNCVQTDYNNDGNLDVFISARRLASVARAAEPAAQQRRRHLHRRYRTGRPAGSASTRPARPGPITTTTAFSTCSSAASVSPTGCTTTRATAHSRRSPLKAGCRKATAVLPKAPPGSTTTTMASPTCSSTIWTAHGPAIPQ